MNKNTNKSLFRIFIVILCDIISFGMIIPLAPILARDLGADGLKVGLLISSYSIVQFLTASYWGFLSDIFGRKPIILCGILGSALAHLFFAFSDTFSQLLLSRLLAGFFGGNIVMATAYIADITSLEKRSKNLGLIGMAFGLGFTIGPLLGFLFILVGESLGDQAPYGVHFAAVGSVLLCFLNFVMTFFFLKESFFPEKQKSRFESFSTNDLSQKRNLKITSGNFFSLILNPLNIISFFKLLKKSFLSFFKKSSLFTRPSFYRVGEALRTPKLGVVLIMSFILWLSLAQIEPVLILLVQDDFGWSKKLAYSSFIYIGLLMVFSQGYLVRKWIPKWGESFVNQKGLLVMALGLLAIAGSSFVLTPSSHFFSLAFWILFLGVSFFSIGYSLSSTSLNGALSLLTSHKEQGSIFGVNQSLSAIARITGPITGGFLYQHFSHASPFIVGGLLGLGALTLALWSKKDFPNRGKITKI